MSTNFHIAPPPKNVDGLPAVPIDIQTIAASFLFDAAASLATADATISYIIGPTAGNPIFDLRQTISRAWLDGAEFPIAKLAHHQFGAGTFDKLRVIESVQEAGSAHTLRVCYNLALPQSQYPPSGGYPPALDWLPGPSLRFIFGLSDLNAARYAEAWLPANLIFDQFSITLELNITGAMTDHSVITNGAIAVLSSNHWSIAFPSRFTALSPMLEVRASNTVESMTDSVTLPISGKMVIIEAWKPVGGAADLVSQIAVIKSILSDNESDYGPYLHGNRFTVYLGSGGMEYEGGTTTAITALLHETFHSWFARGVKPAGQADGWWDEGFTEYHDDGAAEAVPFDFTDSPVILCSRDPWQRITPINSYSEGNAFWKGVAALIGAEGLNAAMGDFYNVFKGASPVSTPMLEEFLICQTGNIGLVDAFHRFVYGFPDGAAPDLWMKDDPAHSGGNEWEGAFWDSPDLWVRNADDGGTEHQAPEQGQDNWFYARVRNKSGAGVAKHFVVAFKCKEWAGTEFLYPDDFLPCVAASVGFELNPGETRIVKARWPRQKVPVAGTHACILAAVVARADHPAPGKHVWEHNNLSQKNTTVVNLQPDWFIIVPVVLTNVFPGSSPEYTLEIWCDRKLRGYETGLVRRSAEFFSLNPDMEISTLKLQAGVSAGKARLLDCGGDIKASISDGLLTPAHPELIRRRFPHASQILFPAGGHTSIRVHVPPLSQRVVGLKITVPSYVKPGTSFKTHLVQRSIAGKKITGGIAVVIKVVPSV